MLPIQDNAPKPFLMHSDNPERKLIQSQKTLHNLEGPQTLATLTWLKAIAEMLLDANRVCQRCREKFCSLVFTIFANTVLGKINV